MDSEIFTEWVKQLDQKFLAQNCKVTFIVDSCPTQPYKYTLFDGHKSHFFTAKHNLIDTVYGSRDYTIVES